MTSDSNLECKYKSFYIYVFIYYYYKLTAIISYKVNKISREKVRNLSMNSDFGEFCFERDF